MTMTQTHTYSVVGMTCEHCVASVTEEVQEIPGIEDIAVDLPTGAVTITPTRDITVAFQGHYSRFVDMAH